MLRRDFIRSLLGLGGAVAAGVAVKASASVLPSRRLLLQTSQVAGFQFHKGDAVWARLRVGDPLELFREPENRYDEWAVGVAWHGHKLGYVPRDENAAVAQLLDRGECLEARITALEGSTNPWDRIEFSVEVVG